jgi:phosphoenolpyruvate synthase/pyruvate phosphate dikinase
VIELSELRRTPTSPSNVGLKAINIGRMFGLGLNCPRGVVIDAGTVAAAIESDSLCAQLASTLLQRLPGPLILRSSASIEDSVEFSCAGQYESVGGIRTVEQFLGAFRVCTESASRADLDIYCSRHGIARDSISMSVIVQKQIRPRYSGVICSRHPMRPNHDEMYVEWSAEACSVVAGAGQPESMSLPRSKGDGEPAVLQHAFLSALVDATSRLESSFEMPVEVEWGVDEQNVLFFFQVRPATLTHDATYDSQEISGPCDVPLLGRAASFGSCQGTLLDVNSKRDNTEAKIAFSSSGNREMIRALAKAEGGVIGSGGILSHVAHLARSQGLPLIIAEGNAANLLGREARILANHRGAWICGM